MRITDLCSDDMETIQQVAALLVEGFKDHWPDAWPNIDSALQEVRESFGADRISRVATGEDGTALGWIGGISQYRGNVWEVHPLVVHPDYQRKGIGRALVADLEEQIRQRGGITLQVGTDDVDNMTTLSGVDLYPNVFEHISKIRNLKDHPFEFYQKLGFVIVGVMPDANGLGKPDIYMAKRVSREQTPDEQFKPGDTVIWWKRIPGGDYVYPVKATVIGVTAKRIKIEADDEGQTATRYVKPSSLQKQD